MIFSTKPQHLFLLVLLLVLPLHQARALLNLDGTKNQIFVFGEVSFGYSTNIFADSTQRGDSSFSGEAGAEYNRRAGLLAVNAIAKVGYQHFNTYTSESSVNPYFSIELIKSTGRATGSFTASAYRESRSDSAVNIRTQSWNIPLGLLLKYPFSEKFYGTSQTGYLKRTYTQDNPALLNYHDYSEELDLFYVYTSKLDLIAGYRIRYSQAASGPETYDHWFNVGATGYLLAKLNGTVRAGYEIRNITGGENFNHFNVSAALNWIVTRKLTITGQLSRDFNTIATGESVDSTVASLSATYSFTRKFDMNAGVAYGRNIFLGRVLTARRDDFFSATIGGNYKINDHFKVGASYTYLKNWSTLSLSDFDRSGYSVTLSCRY